MSENESTPQTATSAVTAAANRPAESVIIRPWPKVVFLYPTFVASTIFFLLSWLNIGVAPETLGNTWMLVFLLNILVFSFDFSRIWSIVMVFGVALLIVLIFWLDLTGYMGQLLGRIHIACTLMSKNRYRSSRHDGNGTRRICRRSRDRSILRSK